MSGLETVKPTCAFCNDLEPPHWTITGASLEGGAKSGCEGCAFIKSAISTFCPIEDVDQVYATVDCALYLRVRRVVQSDPIVLEVFCEPGQATKWKNVGPGYTPSTGGKLVQSVNWIKLRLAECRYGHSNCKVRQETLPRRVIDVGQSSDKVRLYQTDGEKGSYAALSHCWGGHVPLTTTKESLSIHLELIRFESSSQTFLDAVEVTRALGLRYLWIDSLCIIQDDPDDWTVEAAKMNEVYRGATLTLSADSASDASKGLLSRNKTPPLPAHLSKSIPTTTRTGEEVSAFVRQRLVLPSDAESAPHSTGPVQPSKLSTRGWVVQERLLSPRKVHFYDEEMVWSCHGVQRCECRSMPGVPTTGLLSRMLSSSEGSDIDLLLEWPRIVEEFTLKDLTYCKDRLPAISGIAKLFNDTLKTKYHAGLWAPDMAYSLLWMSNHDARSEPIQRIPIRPYAPTWSWASIDGPVTYVNRNLNQFSFRRSGRSEIKTCFTAARITTSPTTSNAYGPVKNAFLTARGQMLPVSYVSGKWSPVIIRNRPIPASALQGPVVEPRFNFDVPSESPEQMDPQAFSQKRFVLLRVATYIWGGTASTESTEVVALLLEFVGEMNGSLIFRRAGMVLYAFHSVRDWEGAQVTNVVIM